MSGVLGMNVYRTRFALRTLHCRARWKSEARLLFRGMIARDLLPHNLLPSRLRLKIRVCPDAGPDWADHAKPGVVYTDPKRLLKSSGQYRNVLSRLRNIFLLRRFKRG
jgi:hypothetical protein